MTVADAREVFWVGPEIGKSTLAVCVIVLLRRSVRNLHIFFIFKISAHL